MERKYKTVPLSDGWRKELDEIKDNINNDRLKDLIAILHTGDILIHKYNEKKRLIRKQETIQMISSYYFAHTFHLAFSIYYLSKIGFGSSSLILVRSIVESSIDLAYLWLCKEINNSDEERKAWFDYENVSKNRMNKMWEDMQNHRRKNGLPKIEPVSFFNKKKSVELVNQSRRFKEEYSRNHWAIYAKLDTRARKVDDTQTLYKAVGINLEELYGTIYRWSSEIVHGDSGSSSQYISENENGLSIDFGPNFKNVDIVLPMTTRVMLSVLYMINHINRLNVNFIEQLKESGFTVSQNDV